MKMLLTESYIICDIVRCRFSLVESIPDEMSYLNGINPYPTTYSVWLDLLAKAAFTVEIASYYWELRDGTAGNFPTGDRVFGLFYII